jgi:Tol biopolymer transport system component/DNA-binding winged helix-turn-helix (wHTH) protein
VTYQFDDVRLDLQRMAITRSGAAVDVEPKAFDVLRHLVEHADRVVTREELLDTVWRDTFVTPNVLSRAVAQLRKALGDDAREARYIETVAKRGYRFIAVVTHDDATPAAGRDSAAMSGISGDLATPDPVVVPAPTSARTSWAAAAAILAMVIGGAALVARRPIPGKLSLPAPERVTTRPGNNTTPAMSPDGRAVAFVSDRTGSLEINVVGLAPGSEAVAITNDGGQNMQPDWSPDGRWIAFHSRVRGGIWIVPSTGGTPQQVVERGSDAAWSADSGRLVYTPDEGGMAGQQVLWTVARDGSDRRQLTTLGQPSGGHNQPAWSHSGRYIAFAVSNGIANSSVWIVDAAGGPPRLLAAADSPRHPQFAPDDTAVFWAGDAASFNGRLFRIDFDATAGTAAGEATAVLPFENGSFRGLSIAQKGLATFGVETTDANLWSIDLGPGDAVSEPMRLTDDAVRSARPDYSRDGRVAFAQFGPGRPISVWSIDEDGSDRVPLALDGPAGSPSWDADGSRVLVMRGGDGRNTGLSWVDVASRRTTPIGVADCDIRSPRLSPDSRAIAFHALEANGAMNVWTQLLDGSPRRRVTNDGEAVSYPAWSHDGRWLAVEVKRGERTQIGVVASEGGAVELLTDDRGQNWPHSWSPDGTRIVYAAERDAVWNLREVSRLTRASRQLTHFTSSSGYVRYPSWSPRGNRIVFERETRTATIWSVRLVSEIGVGRASLVVGTNDRPRWR